MALHGENAGFAWCGAHVGPEIECSAVGFVDFAVSATGISSLHCELGAGVLVVDVVVVGLLADFPFAVDGVGGFGVVRYEAGEDGAFMRGEGFGLF